jgi:hypothetical protein
MALHPPWPLQLHGQVREQLLLSPLIYALLGFSRVASLHDATVGACGFAQVHDGDLVPEPLQCDGNLQPELLPPRQQPLRHHP